MLGHRGTAGQSISRYIPHTHTHTHIHIVQWILTDPNTGVFRLVDTKICTYSGLQVGCQIQTLACNCDYVNSLLYKNNSEFT